MKKIPISILMLFLIFSIGKAQKFQEVKLKAERNNVQVKQNRANGFTIECSLSDIKFNRTIKNNREFISIYNPILLKTFNEGYPNIPVITKLIEVPQDATVEFEVKSFDEQIINLNDLSIQSQVIPASRSVSKSESSVPFVLNEEVYNTDDYFNKDIVKFENQGQMRDIRLGTVTINPIQYNPVRNSLRILNNLVISVKFKNANFAKTNALKRKYSSPYFNKALASQVINFNSEKRELISQSPAHLVIVSPKLFKQELAPFVKWKRQKGFKVTEAYLEDFITFKGDERSKRQEIKTYLQTIYTGDNPMSFVLLVGDVEQIPAWPGTGEHITDLRYFTYTGNDDIPEVLYGRFSAKTIQHLKPQVEKTIMYEKYQMEDPSYLENVLLIAGQDDTNEMLYGNGAMRYIANNYAIEANGIKKHLFLQDPTPPETNETISKKIPQIINQGVAIANYTAHCNPEGWAEPKFEVDQVHNSISNDQKYGLWIGNCCLSVKFDVDECFGEAALRKANGGAIGDIGGSNSTYWDEDYWWAVGNGTPVANPVYEDFGTGAYDATFHTKANEANDISKWVTTQSQMLLAGNMSIQSTNSSRKKYYWEIYHLMGDPTLSPYLRVPDKMTVTISPQSLLIGTQIITVNSAPYTCVALSKDGNLIKTAYSDENGVAELNLEGITLEVGTADLVITGQNKQPHIEQFQITPANQPYVALKEFTTDKAPDYDETVNINVTLQNIANAGHNAKNVVANLTTDDQFVEIIKGSQDYGKIASNTEKNIDNAFTIKIKNNIPDQHVIYLNLKASGEDDTGKKESYNWLSKFRITANAPKIKIEKLVITNDDDDSGILDKGETCKVNFDVTNTGHADAVFSTSLVKVDDPENYITLGAVTQFQNVTIEKNNTHKFTFEGIKAKDNAGEGKPVTLKLTVSAGSNNQYQKISQQDIVIGEVPIFIMGENAENVIATCVGKFYDAGGPSGNYSISQNQIITFKPNGENKFIKIDFTKFKTEVIYDKLRIYKGLNTDGVLVGTYSGEQVPPSVISPKGITINFISDNSGTEAGWEAELSCYVPDQVPECATSPTPSHEAENVYPEKLTWQGDDNNTQTYELYIGTDEDPFKNEPVILDNNTYTLPSSLEPMTTYYWAVIPKNFLGESNHDCIKVWKFTTGVKIVEFEAGEFAVCDVEFYDKGGPFEDYPANCNNEKMTLLPEEENALLKIKFIDFLTEAPSGSFPGDYLLVYDGKDTTGLEPIKLGGKYKNLPEEFKEGVKATNPDGAFTFVFYSDASFKKKGWKALVTCESGYDAYTVTFKVSDAEGNGIKDAKIDFNNKSRKTNKDGLAKFNNCIGTDMAYTVKQENYEDFEGVINVDNHVEVKVTMDKIPSGVNDLNSYINIVPNPNNGIFTINRSDLNTKDAFVEIYSVGGKLILRKELKNNNEEINLGENAKGIYFIKILSEQQVYNSKLIVE